MLERTRLVYMSKCLVAGAGDVKDTASGARRKEGLFSIDHNGRTKRITERRECVKKVEAISCIGQRCFSCSEKLWVATVGHAMLGFRMGAVLLAAHRQKSR